MAWRLSRPPHDSRPRPAAHIRDADATAADSSDMTTYRDMVISLIQDLGWPLPVVYTDAGQSGSGLDALTQAITAGRHDGVFATRPAGRRW